MKNIVLFFVIAITSFSLSAQSAALGTWREHFSFRDFFEFAEAENAVYARSLSGIVRIEKEDFVFEKQTKVNGLQDVLVSAIAFDQSSEQLLVGYQTGFFDIVTNAGVFSVSDIAEGGNFFNREINKIYIDQSNNIAYFATGFGLVSFDLITNEFVETVIFDESVLDVQQYMGRLLVKTAASYYAFELSEERDIQNLNNWSEIEVLAGLEILGVWARGFVFTDQNNSIFNYSESLDTIARIPNFEIEGGAARGERYVVYGFQNEVLSLFDSESPTVTPINDCVRFTFDVLIDEEQSLWFAHQDEYVARFLPDNDDCLRYFINSPFSNFSYRLQDFDDKLWVTSGGLQENYNLTFNGNGFYVFDQRNNFWSNYNRFTNSELDGLFDFYEVATDPTSNQTYVSNFSNGLIVVPRLDSTFTIWNSGNSILENGLIETQRVQTAGMDFDSEGKLWVCNPGTNAALKQMELDGSGQAYRLGSRRDLLDLLVDDSNNKWITLTNTDAGILVFNEGNPTVATDNQLRVFTESNSSLTSNRVNAIVKDLDGDIWVGTGDGIVVMECAFAPFEDCDFSLRIVEENEFDDENSNLFNDESVLSIAVDGANRKWVGTRNGAFLISPDGRSQLLQFNENNSPLPDNQVNAIDVDDETGQVYFSTNSGIVSYQGDATEGEVLHDDELTVFPNPVHPGFSGSVAIKGVAENALVKITEPNGKLIFEGRSNGGLFTWNGRDYLGNNVAPGVYLIFSSNENENNPDTARGKILWMR